MPIRNCRCRKRRCCCWNSTAARMRSPSNRRTSSEIARECGGGDFTWTTRPEDRTNYGRRGTMPTGRCRDCGLVRASWPPTFACRFRVLPTGVTENRRRPEASESCCHRSSVTSATAISIARCCATSMTRTRWRAAKTSCIAFVERAQAMGGTCTGEHGIGQGKQKYLKAELGPEAIDAMRARSQRALDPHNILNPERSYLRVSQIRVTPLIPFSTMR